MTTPVVAVDRFPVDVTVDGGLLRTVRMIMTRPDEDVGTLKVWSAPDVLALDTTFRLSQSDIRSKQVDWTIDTDDGVVTVKSAPGCGCGNRLKYWSPPEFTPMKMGRLR